VQIPLQIVTRGMDASDAVDAAIRKHAEKLDRFCDHITSCRVSVALTAQHRHQGKLYAIHVDLTAPGEEIVSTRGHENEDIYVAIRDTFEAVQRRLEDYVRERRGQVKRHAS
jgi:ribosomal subunit interface protein